MKIIQQGFNLDNEQYYLMHLNIINPILPAKLTDKELEVLAAFMALDKSIIEEGHFNPLARKKVMNKLGLIPAGLSNHLGSMIDKGFLIRNPITKVISIKEFLLPEEDGQGYQFKIVKRK